MLSTRAINNQLDVMSETDIPGDKNLFEEHKEFFNKLADNLACCKNIYEQHIQLKDDKISKTDDAERKRLFEQIKKDNDAELVYWVDSTIEAKANLILAFQDRLTELNKSLKTILSHTDVIGVFSFTLHAVKQVAVYINRINSLLDIMPQPIPSLKFPGIERAKTDVETIYELIKVNRKAFTAHYAGNVTSNNLLMSPKPEKPTAVAEPVVRRFGNCHV